MFTTSNSECAGRYLMNTDKKTEVQILNGTQLILWVCQRNYKLFKTFAISLDSIADEKE